MDLWWTRNLLINDADALAYIHSLRASSARSAENYLLCVTEWPRGPLSLSGFLYQNNSCLLDHWDHLGELVYFTFQQRPKYSDSRYLQRFSPNPTVWPSMTLTFLRLSVAVTEWDGMSTGGASEARRFVLLRARRPQVNSLLGQNIVRVMVVGSGGRRARVPLGFGSQRSLWAVFWCLDSLKLDFSLAF